MARLRISTAIDAAWQADDRVRLLIGSEHAASLAASTPSGGTQAAELTLGELAGQAVVDAVLEADVRPTDVCATLPIGVVLVDPAGNASAVVEQFVQLSDPPARPGTPTLAATANPGEATLTWTASTHVVGDGANFQGLDFREIIAPMRPFAFDVAGQRYQVFDGPAKAGPWAFVADVAPGDLSYLYTAAMPGNESTQRWLLVRAVSRCEVSDVAPAGLVARRVSFDAAGELVLPAPNVPQALTLTPIAGGSVRARWRYAAFGEEAAPVSYRLYVATGVDALPAVGSPTATLTVGAGRVLQLDVGPYADGTTVRAAISSVSSDGAESARTAEVTATADVDAPPAAGALTVEVLP